MKTTHPIAGVTIIIKYYKQIAQIMCEEVMLLAKNPDDIELRKRVLKRALMFQEMI